MQTRWNFFIVEVAGLRTEFWTRIYLNSSSQMARIWLPKLAIDVGREKRRLDDTMLLEAMMSSVLESYQWIRYGNRRPHELRTWVCSIIKGLDFTSSLYAFMQNCREWFESSDGNRRYVIFDSDWKMISLLSVESSLHIIRISQSWGFSDALKYSTRSFRQRGRPIELYGSTI